MSFQLGDTVQKKTGYAWPGIVVAVFKTISGEIRFVVECTVPEVAGALHIYNESQLVSTVDTYPTPAMIEAGATVIKKSYNVLSKEASWLAERVYRAMREARDKT